MHAGSDGIRRASATMPLRIAATGPGCHLPPLPCRSGLRLRQPVALETIPFSIGYPWKDRDDSRQIWPSPTASGTSSGVEAWPRSTLPTTSSTIDPSRSKCSIPSSPYGIGIERFLREIRVTARLDHPHILAVLDSGHASGALWYTMPYVQGESLRDRLRRERRLAVQDAVRITGEIADALDYAHRHHVVHRDIKPENILLADGHARVADFGIAHALVAAGGETLTATGLALGTPAYMSPEQASGSPVDARSDIYGLGCVLYEMLAGEPPFTGPTPQAVITKRFVGPPPSITTLRPDVPAALGAALDKALALEPEARFGTAGEFARAVAEDRPAPPSK